MARHRRTLEEQLADSMGQSRATAGLSFSTPAMAPVTEDLLSPELASNLDNLNTDLVRLNDDLAGLGQDVGRVDDKIAQAINDANAQPLTADRFTENSLDVWPFVHGTVPQGALAPGSVGTDEIADFSIAVKKFKSERHHLY